MAKRTVTTDDLNGDEDATKVVITVNGKGIEVDLAERSAERLTKALEPFWKVGTESDYEVTRRLPGRRTATTPKASGRSKRDYTARDVREWAADNGIDVQSHGRIPEAVLDQFLRS